MTEPDALWHDEPAVSTAPTPSGVSAGALLRAAREEAGLDLAALAVTLKVPERKLEALEADQYDSLPDSMFTRALASSVCRALRIDPVPVLERLPQVEKKPFDGSNTGLNAPFRASRNRSLATAPWLALLLRPGSLVVLALLVGAVVLLAIPSIPALDRLLGKFDSRTGSTVTTHIGTGADGSDAGVRMAAPAPVTEEVATPSQAAVPAPANAAAGMTPVLTAASALKPPVTAEVLRFTVNADTWVEVTDARGNLPLRRLLNPGESVPVEGHVPMRVIVGRADGVKVTVRGQPFDISALARDNVARFEVK